MKHLEIIGFSKEMTAKLEKAIAKEVLKGFPETADNSEKANVKDESDINSDIKYKLVLLDNAGKFILHDIACFYSLEELKEKYCQFVKNKTVALDYLDNKITSYNYHKYGNPDFGILDVKSSKISSIRCASKQANGNYRDQFFNDKRKTLADFYLDRGSDKEDSK